MTSVDQPKWSNAVFAKINHLAITSENYANLSIFYRSLFGLKSDHTSKREHAAISASDGYLGLNFNPRMPGRQAGLDHFGIEVESIEIVRSRISEKYPSVKLVERPTDRPFASYSMHDPAGNYFDLSEPGMSNRGEIYVTGWEEQKRCFSHFALRVLEPERLANFYVDIFELTVKNAPQNGEGFHLTDGRMTMVLLPWDITDFRGSGIERPAPDHIGFTVESIETLQEDLARMCLNPFMRPKPLGYGSESEVRLKLLERCGLGSFHAADPDGVLMAVSERHVQ